MNSIAKPGLRPIIVISQTVIESFELECLALIDAGYRLVNTTCRILDNGEDRMLAIFALPKAILGGLVDVKTYTLSEEYKEETNGRHS